MLMNLTWRCQKEAFFKRHKWPKVDFTGVMLTGHRQLLC